MRQTILAFILVLSAVLPARAQAPNTINTVAGGGVNGTNPVAAYLPLLNSSVVRDSSGNTYISVPTLGLVYKVDTQGNLSTYAGSHCCFSGDGGPATQASLTDPEGIALDSSGNLFIADLLNNRVRRVDATTHVITTVAGSGQPDQLGSFGGDGGPATSARLNEPTAVAVDANGNLFIADSGNHRVRKVDTSGTITTVAGNGNFCSVLPCGDGGPATNAQLSNAGFSGLGVALDSAANIYITDSSFGSRIRVVNTQPTAITVAGVAIQPGNIATVVGSGGGCSGQLDSVGDGCAANLASLNGAAGTSLDQSGNLFIADSGNYRIREVVCATGAGGCVAPSGETAGDIYTVVGNGTPCTDPTTGCGDGGSPTNALLNAPSSVFVDSLGNTVIADAGNQRVRVVSAGSTPTISNFAGGGNGGDGGPATSAILGAGFYMVGIDSSGNLFILENAGLRLRRVDAKTQTITTVAGNGVEGVFGQPNGDGGPAAKASFIIPLAMSLDAAGNVYIGDELGLAVRVVNTQTAPITVAGVTIQPGSIATIAGDNLPCFGAPFPNAPPGCGDGGPATSASVSPLGVAVDSLGNVYIADSGFGGGTNRIRKVDGTTGVISNFAGTGAFCSSPSTGCGNGGPATQAQLSGPFGMAFDSQGNLFFVDSGDNQIRKIDTNQVISLVAFNGQPTFGGDGGPATSASMNLPGEVALDTAGNVFIGGGVDNVVQRVDALTQTIATVAGDVNNLGGGFSGDGGLATQALIANSGLVLDSSHNLYIADSVRVRKVKLAPAAQIPTPLTAFAATLPGDTSDPQFLTILNAGLDDLTISNVQSTNPDFVLTLQCPGSVIAPTLSCSIEVQFAPPVGAVAGNVNGSLTFNTNDPLNPAFNIALSGVVAATPGFPLTVSFSATETGNGVVNSDPVGLSCATPNPCTVFFPAGQVVTLTPLPASGSSFTQWSGACSGATTCAVTMSQAQSVTAEFDLSQVVVTIIGNGTGTVVSNPAGINCPTTCAFTFPGNPTVTLTATPTAGGPTFAGWMGGGCFGTGTCQIVPGQGAGNQGTTAVFSTPTVPFTQGDVFLGTSNGMIFEFNSSGTIVQVLPLAGSPAGNLNIDGMTFDATGDLYATFNGNQSGVAFYAPSGAAPTAFGSGFASFPNSVVLDNAGDVFVGQATGTPNGAGSLLEFAAGTNGSPTSTFLPAFESGGTAGIALLQDQETMLYTSLGNDVKSFDVKLNVQDPDFATNLPNPIAYEARQLADGSVLVADGASVVRLNANGNLIQTYTPPSPANPNLETLYLDPDGNTFWTADTTSGLVIRFNILTGAQAGGFSTPLAINQALSTLGIRGIAVFGTPATAGTVAVAPNSLAFGAQVVNTTSQSQPVTVSVPPNSASVTISAISVPTGFTETDNCAGVTIQASGSCTINVTFAPTTVGPFSGNLSITDTAGGSPQTVALTGTSVSGNFTVAPSSLNFGAVVINTTSPAQAVTVTNGTVSNVSVTSITTPTGFNQTNNCISAEVLQPGQSCAINLTFAPTTAGSFSGNLSITDTAGGSPQTVTLTGTGVSGQFTVAPASLNFGTVVINTTSPAQIVTVTNGTTNSVLINAITVPAGFAETDNCVTGDGPPLASGASCTINVTFTPTSATAFSGNLTILDSISAPPPTVALTGNGTNSTSTFTLTLAPGSSSTVTVVPGGTAAYGILVTGTPGINQTINFTASTTSNTITVTVTPKSVTITGNGNTQFALVLQTFCRAAGIGPNPRVPGGGLKLLLLAMALAAMAWIYRRRPRWALSFALLMLIAIGGAACGGDPGANGPTPPGTYPVTLTATSGQQVQTLNLTLIVQ